MNAGDDIVLGQVALIERFIREQDAFGSVYCETTVTSRKIKALIVVEASRNI